MFKTFIPSLVVSFLIIFSGSFNLSAQQQENHIITKETRVFYSVFVQSFYDSNNDGIGDIQGLTSKLGYLKELGIGGLSLLPIHPSPTYHKYDIKDYLAIHSDYGTMDDYKELVKKAHELEMVVLLDLVANHTSNMHPWFKKAVSGNNKYRNYYVWSNNQADFENNPFQWHEVRNEKGDKQEGEKYYGYFWWEMPDLNFDEPMVREEIINIGKFWMEEVGVDGFRLDNADHIYPDNQADKNILWWSEFNKKIKEINEDALVFGDISGGSEKISPYLESGFSGAYNFELSDTIRKSVKSGIDLGIVHTIKKIEIKYSERNRDFDDATLLTNHNMERVMTEFSRDDNMAKVCAAILLTIPGTPFIYYGEEIGMLGEKPDEYIREPFIWNIEGEDVGQTKWEIPYSSSSRTVKPLFYQLEDRASMYNHYKGLINLRNQSSALKNGLIIDLKTQNPAVVSYLRLSDKQEAMVIINISAEMQQIPTPRGLDGFELAYSNYNVFKLADKEINLQPYGIFVLTRPVERILIKD